jgi:predicted ATPase
VESHEVLELMSRLVAKSLVNVNKVTERETRFSCHETIRQYAHEKLIEAGEGEKIRRQHLKYFLKLSELAEPANYQQKMVGACENFPSVLRGVHPSRS